jgi:hypothetical protein
VRFTVERPVPREQWVDVAILTEGFRDGVGTYGFASTTLSGVFVADRPADVSDGVPGHATGRRDLPPIVAVEASHAGVKLLCDR